MSDGLVIRLGLLSLMSPRYINLPAVICFRYQGYMLSGHLYSPL
jgi:hypothetical protein